MIQTLNTAKESVRETQDNMIYVGIAVYLITYEWTNFKV